MRELSASSDSPLVRESLGGYHPYTGVFVSARERLWDLYRKYVGCGIVTDRKAHTDSVWAFV